MNEQEIKTLVDNQRHFFATGATLPSNYRINSLRKLRQSILAHKDEIENALYEDLGKSQFEAYMCEIGLALSELSYMLKHTKQFAREKRVSTPLTHFPAKNYKKPSPYGTVLIMSPWNYPFLLTIDPLIDAISAGNTVVVKPSAYSPATSNIIKIILEESFSSEYVSVITGGRSENSCLLQEKFDYIFFTGSQAVGHDVMKYAAENLTPVTLELGGKSPCIVDSTANIKLAAKRIVFGKYLNCGQTCVAPDYVYCHRSVEKQFLEAVSKEIESQYTADPLNNPSYGKIINQKHFSRITSLIDSNKVFFGGRVNEDTSKIAPTVMQNITWDDAVMQQEIFGPIMPVLTYENDDEVLNAIAKHPAPLALYLFTSDKQAIKKYTSLCRFGGGCINDTIIHLATSNMGFGGMGASGMGSYHGKDGFMTFSHEKALVHKRNWLDLSMRYQPYSKLNDKLLKMFLK